MAHLKRNLVAYLALFVALSGTAYAGLSIPVNSVGTAQLKKSAVTLVKIAPKAQAALRGQRGPRGYQGPKGDQGIPGPDTGVAGGDLAGNYPDPTIAGGAVTPAKFGTIPAARAHLGQVQGTNSGAQEPIGMTVVDFDTDNVWSNGNGAETLKAPIAGVYQIDGGLEWAANGTGSRFAGIDVNTTCCYAASWVPAAGSGDPTIQNVSDLLRLNAGDRVFVIEIQDSGGSLDVNPTNGTFLAMHWVGP